MNQSDLDNAVALAREHWWIMLAAFIVWGIVRVAKDDPAVKRFPVEIAARWRSWAAIILGILVGIVHKFWVHGPWGEAFTGGFASAVLATYGHEIVIESLRRGRDIGTPKPPDDPGAPKPPPPISIKPPGNVTITGAMLGLLVLLTGCPALRRDAELAGPLVINGAACRQKAIATVRDGGTCQERLARVNELLATDPDCADIDRDAGPRLHCMPKDGGADER